MAKSTSSPVGALQFLLSPGGYGGKRVYVLAGDDSFLRHEVRGALASELTGEDEPGLAMEFQDGNLVELRDVLDALSERSLFSSGDRIVVLEEADTFVQNHREQLEQYVEKPNSSAVLVLEVSSWPGNTRLAKSVAKSGLTIICTVPSKGRELTQFTKQLKDWLVDLARRHCDVELMRPAADLLVDLVPLEPGLLYQEVSKLSLLTEKQGVIDVELVRTHVGGWRARKTWDMIDAAAEGRAADALEQLDRLLAAGEDPHGLLPQMASTLRKFAAATRNYEQAERRRQPISLRNALQEAGVLPFKLSDAEGQLKQLGRPRAKQLYRWLLAADLELKGHNSTKDRARRVLETLIVRLSRQAAPPRKKVPQ